MLRGHAQLRKLTDHFSKNNMGASGYRVWWGKAKVLLFGQATHFDESHQPMEA